MGATMTTSARPTLPNDGSVSDDPCQACEGRLVLRNVRSGGWFLGCSNYPKGCTFKMAPNAHQMEQLEAERAERRAERARKRAERDLADRKKREAAERKAEALAPKFCEGCYSTLSNVDVQSGRVKHSWC